jgi:hypothetical protein
LTAPLLVALPAASARRAAQRLRSSRTWGHGNRHHESSVSFAGECTHGFWKEAQTLPFNRLCTRSVKQGGGGGSTSDGPAAGLAGYRVPAPVPPAAARPRCSAAAASAPPRPSSCRAAAPSSPAGQSVSQSKRCVYVGA